MASAARAPVCSAEALMQISSRILLWATAALLFTSHAYPQHSPPTETTRGNAKKEKKQTKKSAKEVGDTRTEWLEQDAKYIMTPAEREAFLKLGTNEER